MKKLLVIFLVHVSLVQHIRGYEDPASKSEDADDMEMEEILRRKNDFFNREWQYEGLPIDAVSFRRAMAEDAKTRKPGQVQDTSTTQQSQSPKTKSVSYRRIFNAESEVTIKDHPYMAALLVNNQLWCGAAIVSEDSIITAAHCLQLQHNNRFFREYFKMLSVRVGSSNATDGGQVYQVLEIFFHPNYKPQNLEFNFAILKLDKNLTLGLENTPVDIINLTKQEVLTRNQKIDFLGWGSELDSGKGGQVLLQKLSLPVYDTVDCREVYGKELVSATGSNFCAGYISVAKNVCNHDAGGPAILNGELVGILSFSSKRCDEPDKPAVFSSVAAVQDWVQGVLTKGKQKTFKLPEATRRRG